jgi:ribonucleotide reductase beta subunit family protein with ferritin-like domain/intein/homing endonuclease
MYLKNNELTRRYSIFPITHQDLWNFYKKAEKQTWVAEEIDLSQDTYDALNEEEKLYLKNILAFFAISDGLVIDNLATNFMSEVDLLEAQYFYGHQTFIEQVHCVTGDTFILTNSGNKPIKDCLNSQEYVWNGDTWSKVTIVETGVQDIYNVKLSNGMHLNCTDEHEFWIRKGNYRHPENCKREKVKLKDIKIGDIIADFNLPNPTTMSLENNLENAYINGFFSAGEKFFVPIGDYSLKDKLNWLEGYLDGDGCIKFDRKKEYTTIQFASINRKFISDVQILLTELGCTVPIKLNNLGIVRTINGNLTQNQDIYVGYISGYNVKKLVELGFCPKRLVIKVKDFTTSSRPTLIRVESIKKLEKQEMTYCFNEPLNHSGVFNGILTGQSNGYSLLIDTYIKDNPAKEALFNAMETNPAVNAKASWAEQWIQHPSFAQRLVAFACVEGIAFSSVFAGVFWFRSRNLMKGLGAMNELILKDESLHYDFAVYLYNNYLKPEYKLDSAELRSIILSCYEAEKTFVENSLPKGLKGLSVENMVEYVQFVVDTVLNDFGLEKEFKINNPLDYMKRIGITAKNNFFEERVGQYTRVDIPTSTEGLFDDDDF